MTTAIANALSIQTRDDPVEVEPCMPLLRTIDVSESRQVDLPRSTTRLEELYATGSAIQSVPHGAWRCEVMDVSRTAGLRAIEGRMPMLNELDLSWSSVESIPHHLPGLRIVNASKSRLRSLPSRLPKAEEIDISHTEIPGLPKILPAVRVLNVSHTGIYTLPRMPNVEELDISHTLITKLPKYMPRLKVLVTTGTGVQIPDLPELEVIVQ